MAGGGGTHYDAPKKQVVHFKQWFCLNMFTLIPLPFKIVNLVNIEA